MHIARIVRRSVVAAMLAAAALAWWLWPPSSAQPLATAFTLADVTVVQPAESRRDHVGLVVADGMIAKVTNDGTAASPESLAGLRGTFVVPGIIDMHTHLPADTPLRLTELFGILYALHGVTSVREAGDIDGTAVPAATRAFEAKGAVGPRVFSCGPFVGGGTPRFANTIIVNDPSEASAVAHRLAAEGRVCMKIYDGLDAARTTALAKAARAAGLRPIGHVPFGLEMENAGVPEIQHLMGTAHHEGIAAGDQVVHRVMDWTSVDDARIAEVVRLSRELGISHTPTMVSNEALLAFLDYDNGRRSPPALLLPRIYRDVVWKPREGLAPYRAFDATQTAMVRDALEKKMKTVRALDDAGVPLFIGTDTQQPFVVPGISAQQEMRLFARAGIAPDRVWRHATADAGATLPVPSLGRLDAGAPADFVVFRRDPTVDVTAFDSLEAVSIRGRLYLRKDLDVTLRRYLDWYANPLLDWVAVTKVRALLAKAVQATH